MDRREWMRWAVAAPLAASPAPDLTQELRAVDRSFQQARPTEKDLAFYSLDWAESLAVARRRALAENRSVFLFLNTNISAGTNFFRGHT